MKKIVAIVVLGIGLASCGHSNCPAYTSDSFDFIKKIKKNNSYKSIDTGRIQEI